jgi:hypothetical protein
MKHNFSIKALWLIALLCCGVWSANAQSLQFKQGANIISGIQCMDVTSPGITYSVEGVNLSTIGTNATIVGWTWTTQGGITITEGANAQNVKVAPLPGTDYNSGYSKYAKGKLKVTCRVQYDYNYLEEECTDSGPIYHNRTYTYFTNLYGEFEIRKQFSDLTGNEITGPECVKTGDRVTYSVAPWVSMYQLNTVGFDEYDWDIPSGVAQGDVLYYSADYSSVTFYVGNNFDGKTISVRMGACNLPGQTPITLTLRAQPGVPSLPDGISFATGWCLPLGTGAQSITIGNTDPSATYIWEGLEGWKDTPTYEVNEANGYTLNFIPQNDARELTLRVIDICGNDKEYKLKVNRTLSGSNLIQTVSGEQCVAPNQYVPFKVTGVDNSVALIWRIVEGEGWSIYPGAETSAQPFIMTGTGSATIEVTASGCPGSTTIQETFGLAPETPIINSVSPVCVSDATVTFKVRKVESGVTYEWSYPGDWTVETGTADDQSTISLVPGQQGGEVKVRAIGTDNCSSDWSDPIEVAAPLALSKVTDCVNAGFVGIVEIQIEGYDPENAAYDFPTIDDSTFGTIDPAGIDAAGVFKVNTTGKEGNFTVSVSATNSCGDQSIATLDYSVQKDPFTVQEVVVLDIPGMQVSSFKIMDTGYQDFEWSGDGQPLPTVIPGVLDYITNNIIVSDYSSIYVTVTNSATGCKTRKFRMAPNVFRSKSANPNATAPNTVNEFIVVEVIDAPNAGQLTLFPNPASNELNINLSSEGSISICIASMSGGIVKNIASQQSSATIDVADLPAGNYIAVVLQGTNRYTGQFIKR